MSPKPTTRSAGTHLAATLLALGLVVLFASAASACPTCKDAVGGDPNAAGVVKGYFWSILFMMSMPFLIFFGLGSYFYWEVRKARFARASGGDFVADPS